MSNGKKLTKRRIKKRIMTAFEWKTFFVWRVTYICVHVTQAQFLPTSSKHVSPGMRFLGLGIGGLSHQSCMSLHIGTNNIVGGSISTRCGSLYPKCNRISSNKSMDMTPYSPIPRRQRHFVDCQRQTRMTQLTKDFAMRHDENYVEWNGISIKWYQFLTNCPYHQTIFQE